MRESSSVEKIFKQNFSPAPEFDNFSIETSLFTDAIEKYHEQQILTPLLEDYAVSILIQILKDRLGENYSDDEIRPIIVDILKNDD